MFKNHCSGCGKTIMSYASDKQGTLPVVFCNGACETLYRKDKSMLGSGIIVNRRKSINTDELNQRMSQKPWNNQEYLTEEIQL